jgi:hypothetical protein
VSRLTILQVGDVHFPTHDAANVDQKDSSVPETLVKLGTGSILQASTRALIGAIAEEPRALLVFTGDLTTAGALAGYRNCVSYLVRALDLDDSSRWSQDRLQVVPGNHDVDRKLVKPNDLFAKFKPLRDVWDEHALPIIATTNARRTLLTDGPASLTAYGLNSCLGCGEKRKISVAIRKLIEKRVTRALVKAEVEKTKAVKGAVAVTRGLGETLDAPAYSHDDVQWVCEDIATSGVGLPVLIAHHNLLQQATPRVGLYTDVMNAGLLRTRLGGLRRPVLYLHGHIHDDPIESVVQSAPGAGQIVCISVPEFHQGFNKIEITFSDDGRPLGCAITRYRTSPGGVAAPEAPVRVRFESDDFPMSPLAATVAAHLLENAGTSSLKELMTRQDSSTVNEERLYRAVEEVEWLGLVRVLDRERPFGQRRLRVVPRNE